MNLIDVLNQIWTQILGVMSIFVMPDWGFVISLLPILIVIGLIGPFLTGLMIGTLAYLVTKPRVKIAFVEGPHVAEIGPGGDPVFPVGLPHCRRHALVYPSGTLRCDQDGDPLTVVCPMCGLGRVALIDTCSNCGLVLKVKPHAVAVRTRSGPKPGGAAAA
ncbi:MAG: hypothetical protein ABI562_05810 [Chloroflexota bacterium]